MTCHDLPRPSTTFHDLLLQVRANRTEEMLSASSKLLEKSKSRASMWEADLDALKMDHAEVTALPSSPPLVPRGMKVDHAEVTKLLSEAIPSYLPLHLPPHLW